MTSAVKSGTDQRARLASIVKVRSVETGREFKLASGRTSTFYCNLKPTMLDAEGAFLIGKAIIERLTGMNVELVGGLEMGAVPLATVAAALSHGTAQPLRAFFVRKKPKEHGTESLIEGLPRGESLRAKRIAILEDVTTTGGSALKAVELVRAAGGVVVIVLTIVDRLEGAAEAFAAAGVPFSSILTRRDLE
jgi:orotate phosphoribosyltransferase